MPIVTRVLVALLLALPLAAVAAPQAGEDFRVLDEPQPTDGETTEVLEFFSYGCPHCFDFRPRIESWHSNTTQPHRLQRVPVTFGRDSWSLLARAYYVAESLGVLDQTHAALFDALHVDNRQLTSPEAIADFYASQGVDRDEALKAFDSFAVNMKMRRAERLVRDYRIRSTPSVAVDGRFVTDPRAAGGQESMLEVLDYLLAERVGG